MKNQGKFFLILVLAGVLFSSCTKNDGSLNQESLKMAINQSTESLNMAVSEIVSTRAYSILTVSGLTAKSATDDTYKVYIPLDKVKGVYNYKPFTKKDNWGTPLIRFFSKTGEDSKMIVNMPLKKITQPGALRRYSQADSLLTNNFSIAVSAYHNNYNNYHDYDYNLVSEISINDTLIGNLNIESVISPALGTDYKSQYSFAGGYSANYSYVSGDTTVSGFSIKDGDKILYEEMLKTVRNDTARFGREHQYILTIGNVQIIRKSGTKDVQIAVDGIIQTGAVVTIVDKESDSEASVCKKREVQITFEDGTVSTVSALIGASVDNIKTLFTSLHNVYFAAYIVDWIAYDIYYQR
jgi:hypothetical protein